VDLILESAHSGLKWLWHSNGFYSKTCERYVLCWNEQSRCWLICTWMSSGGDAACCNHW